MSEIIKIKAEYTLSRCCNPTHEQQIIGYHSHTASIKVHSIDCTNLAKTDQSRLVTLSWSDIIEDEQFSPNEKYISLSEEDFKVLEHHLEFDIDYSLKVAKDTGISKERAFEIHSKLKEIQLLKRVESTMVRYRKKQLNYKWIKHRNHTYYQLTDLGKKYIEYYMKNRKNF